MHQFHARQVAGVKTGSFRGLPKHTGRTPTTTTSTSAAGIPSAAAVTSAPSLDLSTNLPTSSTRSIVAAPIPNTKDPIRCNIVVCTRVRPLLPHLIRGEGTMRAPAVSVVGDQTVVVMSTLAPSSHWQTDSGLPGVRVSLDDSVDLSIGAATSYKRVGGGQSSTTPRRTHRPLSTMSPSCESFNSRSPSSSTMNDDIPASSTVFSTDAAFGSECSQADVYEGVDVSELLDDALQATGSCGTVMCCGPTGSGKTHTMLGNWFTTKKESTDRARQAAEKRRKQAPGVAFRDSDPKHDGDTLDEADGVESYALNGESEMLSSNNQGSPSTTTTFPAQPSELGTDLGLLPRAVHSLLAHLRPQSSIKDSPTVEASQQPKLASIKLYSIELYLDEVRDLLYPSGKRLVKLRDGVALDGVGSGAKQNHGSYRSKASTLLHDMTASSSSGATDGSVGGGDLSYRLINSMEDMYDAYDVITRNRVTGEHSRNPYSSRSHALFVIRLDFTAAPVANTSSSTPVRGGASSSRHLGKSLDSVDKMFQERFGPSVTNAALPPSFLSFVDLAGSERIVSTDVEGVVLQETKFINRSLASLSTVIGALNSGDSHIPYRDSKLTRLLRPCLEGSRVTVVMHAPPGTTSCDEALHALRFGDQLRQVQLSRKGGSLFVDAEKEQMIALLGGVSLLEFQADVTSDIILKELMRKEQRVHAELVADLRIFNAESGIIPRRLQHRRRRQLAVAKEGPPPNKVNESPAADLKKATSSVQRLLQRQQSSRMVPRRERPEPFHSLLWKDNDIKELHTAYSTLRDSLLTESLEPIRAQQRLVQHSHDDLTHRNDALKAEIESIQERSVEEAMSMFTDLEKQLKRGKRREDISEAVKEALRRREGQIIEAEEKLSEMESTFGTDLDRFNAQDAKIRADIERLRADCQRATGSGGLQEGAAKQVAVACETLASVGAYVEFLRGRLKLSEFHDSLQKELDGVDAHRLRMERRWSEFEQRNPWKAPVVHSASSKPFEKKKKGVIPSPTAGRTASPVRPSTPTSYNVNGGTGSGGDGASRVSSLPRASSPARPPPPGGMGGGSAAPPHSSPSPIRVPPPKRPPAVLPTSPKDVDSPAPSPISHASPSPQRRPTSPGGGSSGPSPTRRLSLPPSSKPPATANLGDTGRMPSAPRRPSMVKRPPPKL